MKRINFRNGVEDAISEAGINLICDTDMNLLISDEDYERLQNEFPAAFDDCYVIEDEDNINYQRERIGRRIADLRKQRGMTQQELADKTGMKQSNIARIEAGRYSARFDTLQTIAEAMGLTVDFIAGYQ